MVLKGANEVHSDKIRSNGSVRSQFWYTIQKLGQMVLKGVNWAHNDKLGQMVLKGVNWVHKMTKLGQMVLKEANWAHNDKIRSNGLERSQLSTQW